MKYVDIGYRTLEFLGLNKHNEVELLVIEDEDEFYFMASAPKTLYGYYKPGDLFSKSNKQQIVINLEAVVKASNNYETDKTRFTKFSQILNIECTEVNVFLAVLLHEIGHYVEYNKIANSGVETFVNRRELFKDYIDLSDKLYGNGEGLILMPVYLEENYADWYSLVNLRRISNYINFKSISTNIKTYTSSIFNKAIEKEDIKEVILITLDTSNTMGLNYEMLNRHMKFEFTNEKTFSSFNEDTGIGLTFDYEGMALLGFNIKVNNYLATLVTSKENEIKETYSNMLGDNYKLFKIVYLILHSIAEQMRTMSLIVDSQHTAETLFSIIDKKSVDYEKLSNGISKNSVYTYCDLFTVSNIIKVMNVLKTDYKSLYNKF